MITVWKLAQSRGLKLDSDGRADGNAFSDVGLSIVGGCAGCEATLAAYNAYPTKTGWWMCSDCVGDQGFNSTEECEQWLKQLDTGSDPDQLFVDF